MQQAEQQLQQQTEITAQAKEKTETIQDELDTLQTRHDVILEENQSLKTMHEDRKLAALPDRSLAIQ